MHETAYTNGMLFFQKYCSIFLKESIVVDFGSYDVNGTLKPIFNKFKYIGIDMSEGPNVDIVCDSKKTPLNDNYADIIISSSCFEHDNMFWLTFLEMCRILKNGGLIYINAPSEGFYHGFPGDCWRFYKDSWKALADWAKMNNYNIELIENYIDPNGIWKDSVGIFKISK